jgi:hypothetical protein
MKNFIVLSSFLILLCGCAISNSTHSFVHYGSDSLRDDSDFFYIQHGVLGSASAVYSNRGGGNVRAGLIADAKANMLQQHVLGPNQTYINMSIDIIKTEAGTALGKGVSINSVTWTAVISSDIIEYGTAPQEEYTKKNITTGSVDAQINKLIESVKETESVEEPPALDQQSSDITFALGDKVIYTKEGESFDAIVIRVNSSSDTYGLEYTDSEGKTKRRSVKKSELKLN